MLFPHCLRTSSDVGQTHDKSRLLSLQPSCHLRIPSFEDPLHNSKTSEIFCKAVVTRSLPITGKQLGSIPLPGQAFLHASFPTVMCYQEIRLYSNHLSFQVSVFKIASRAKINLWNFDEAIEQAFLPQLPDIVPMILEDLQHFQHYSPNGEPVLLDLSFLLGLIPQMRTHDIPEGNDLCKKSLFI